MALKASSIRWIVLFATVILSYPQLFSAPDKQDALLVGRVFDAPTGQKIPCTVIIRTSANSIITENPAFAGGFRSSGEFEKAVPPGVTTITVERGFDYVASERKVTLRPGERLQLIFRLRRQADLRRMGWYCGDSHVHMIHGPKAPNFPVTFPYVALAARAAGLDYLSIAQNWNLPPSKITPARLNALCRSVTTPHFTLRWNMEVPKNYWRGDVTHCLGHCWFLGMRSHTPSGRGVIQELFEMSDLDYQSQKISTPNFQSQALIHSLGGIVVYTHPCRWGWGTWGGKGIYTVEKGKFISNLAQELPYDTVVGPTYDAMDILMQSWDHKASLEAQKLWFLLLSKGYRMPATASTDSSFGGRGADHVGDARVYTHVDGPPAMSKIAVAMKEGRNFVTTGPLLLMEIGGHPVGDVIHLIRPSDFQVKLQAWPSGAVVGEHLTTVELIRDGEITRKFLVAADSRTGEFTAEFTIHETGTAWYVARCFGSNDLQVAITNPIYFEGSDYRQPEPTLAHVTGIVTSDAGIPLDGECEVIRMVGLTPVELSKHPFTHGRFTLDVPGTARLRVRACGYTPVMESVFMGYKPLLQMTLNMREAELTDWRTFEEMKKLLSNVRLQFRLTPSEGRR
jgi:hypothetical protein